MINGEMMNEPPEDAEEEEEPTRTRITEWAT